ncbi:phage capsid protein [Erwinia typographi]|uniref:Phage capsid protein n=1 Tax=Erwinia typographi TaxID=371042 RepID=A0A0A3ZKH3_9GAMM|nr:phage major capsid protein [Erwinia typographi]KGT86258.1 phage capsid protein [Erwinia typographi]
MKQQHAVSLLKVKAVNEETREITGIATTPTPDRYGDIMVPEGAEFQLPIPLLWQHDHQSPIGEVTSAKVTPEGIEIKAKLAKADTPSQLAARLEEAWQSIRLGLVKGLSIGFLPIEYAYIDEGGIRFTRWEWYELSVVTVPANAEGTIQVVKSIDEKLRAASGHEQPESNPKNTAGATAKKITPIKGTKMNIAEQIKSFETKRATLDAEREAVMAKSFEEGRTLDAEEEEKYDEVSAEIKSVDAHLARLRELESTKAATAQPVNKAANGTVINTTEKGAPAVIHVEKPLEKGIAFARFTKSLAAANGSRSEALEIAKRQYPRDAKLHHVLKSAVGAGTTTDPQWAGSLVEYQEYAEDFIEFLRPKTIVGQFGQGNIPQLRKVPFNIRIHAQTSGGSASWVGQGKAKPLTRFDFESVTFGFSKVATIAVITDELIRFSNPAADAMVRDQLAEAVIARLDIDFVNPAKAAVPDVSPASITNGATQIPSSGDPDTDSSNAFQVFIDAELQPTGGVWLMSSTTALALSKRKNALGQKEYPDMTMFGGVFEGLPAIVSQYVGNLLVLVNAPDIYLADDGGVAVDMSREASLEMESEPSGDSITPTPTEMVSMFQTNSVAIRAERWINWKRRRTAAVAVITGVNYGANPGS